MASASSRHDKDYCCFRTFSSSSSSSSCSFRQRWLPLTNYLVTIFNYRNSSSTFMLCSQSLSPSTNRRHTLVSNECVCVCINMCTLYTSHSSLFYRLIVCFKQPVCAHMNECATLKCVKISINGRIAAQFRRITSQVNFHFVFMFIIWFCFLLFVFVFIFIDSFVRMNIPGLLSAAARKCGLLIHCLTFWFLGEWTEDRF